MDVDVVEAAGGDDLRRLGKLLKHIVVGEQVAFSG